MLTWAMLTPRIVFRQIFREHAHASLFWGENGSAEASNVIAVLCFLAPLHAPICTHSHPRARTAPPSLTEYLSGVPERRSWEKLCVAWWERSQPERLQAFKRVRTPAVLEQEVTQTHILSVPYRPQPKMQTCWEPAGLPEVIWRQIAETMSVKEYAQMSGTCKVFSYLLPQVPGLCLDTHLRDEPGPLWPHRMH